MGTMVQIIYISRSTSGPASGAQEVDPVVSRILAKSRGNNRKNGLTGVLYFGNGCFFQCLEGEATAIDTLYAKLGQDDRHRDLKLISRKSIDHPSFSEWSMKYVPVDKEMAALLARNGMSEFDPYRFDTKLTQEVIALLQGARAPDVVAPTPQVAPRPAPAAPAVPSAPGISKGVLAVAGLILLAIGFALGRLTC